MSVNQIYDDLTKKTIARRIIPGRLLKLGRCLRSMRWRQVAVLFLPQSLHPRRAVS